MSEYSENNKIKGKSENFYSEEQDHLSPSANNYFEPPLNKPKPKKYVFQIYPENVSYIENLAISERSEVINDLLSNYLNYRTETQKIKKTSGIIEKIVIGLLVSAIALPLIIALVNLSIHSTFNSYKEMQGNFEKLYQNKGKF